MDETFQALAFMGKLALFVALVGAGGWFAIQMMFANPIARMHHKDNVIAKRKGKHLGD